MKVLFTSAAAESHLAPLLPFAEAVRARGHEVRIAVLPRLGQVVTDRGFAHLPLDGPTDEMRAAFSKRVAGLPMSEMEKVYRADFFIGLLSKTAAPGLARALEDWRPDLIVRETTECAGLMAAEIHGIRHIRHEIVNGRAEEAFGTEQLDAFNALRAAVSLPPAAPDHLAREVSVSAHPQALDATRRVNTLSPLRYLADRPAAADPEAGAEWRPVDGVPLVYATFGTVAGVNDRTKPVYRAAMAALAELPVRALFTTGANAVPDLFDHIAGNVSVRPFVPQAEVLPHARLVLCHGGSGTVIAALAQGLPTVIVPMFADQPDNAAALDAGGFGVAVTEPSPETIRAAILKALDDAEMRERAAQAAAEIAAMPPAAEVAAQVLDD